MKKVHIDPLSDRVVVMPEEVDEMTASGIILPDTAKEKPQMGKIIAAGPKPANEDPYKYRPNGIKVLAPARKSHNDIDILSKPK